MKKKARLTPLQQIMDGISILICLAALVYLIVIYPSLPEQIPSHYDFSGNITSYSGKSLLIVLACVMLFAITLPMSLLSRVRKLAEIANTPFRIPNNRKDALSELTRTMLCAMNLILTAMFAYILYCNARCENMNSAGIWLPMVLIGALIVWYCVRCWKLSKQPKEWEPWDD